jgi:hypothetical protein
MVPPYLVRLDVAVRPRYHLVFDRRSTVKLAVLAVLALLPPTPEIRFDADGLRVDGAVVTGRVLELKSAGSALLLASGSSVEALAPSLEIELAADRTLVLEPGIRVDRGEGGYRFAAHRSGPLRFSSSTESIAVAGPVTVAVTVEGWKVGERNLVGHRLQASVQTQDDAETTIAKLQQGKEKKPVFGPPKPVVRKFRLFHDDPLIAGNAAGSVVIRLIGRVSPDGAP